MRRRPAILLAAIALASAAGGAVAAAPHPAVARISVVETGGQAFGSGTLIDVRDRYALVVTNWHVVEGAVGKIEVTFPSGFKSEALALKLDETWDLAALVIWRPPTEPVAIAKRPPQSGERLTICGYGQGEYRAISGQCRSYYSPRTGYPQEIVELDVEARQGDSGGPIFNQRGELAGVLFGAGQGTTLGSFGPRVERFLATLSPGAARGEGRPQLVKQAAPAAAAAAEEPAVAAEQGPTGPADLEPAGAVAAAGAFPAPAPVETPAEAPEIEGLPGPTVDWLGEGKTLLAIVALAFVLMQGARLMV
ncbi:Serine protease [Pirellulimonas nuda]|uniref:Serine protease n=1 Tax=Pirellulimonas nuda TaxID=2528009 RepID=A0A518D8D2_9BACT|nr:serine protease [Pirellulimonas nuda]QDU87737.1 Serine protease [Pirellulimonas nuda]